MVSIFGGVGVNHAVDVPTRSRPDGSKLHFLIWAPTMQVTASIIMISLYVAYRKQYRLLLGTTAITSGRRTSQMVLSDILLSMLLPLF